MLHGVLALCVFFYAKTEAHPLPRGPINRTYHSLTAFAALSYILGVIVGLSDAFLVMALVRPLWPGATRHWSLRVLAYVGWVVVGLCITFFFAISPLIFSVIETGPAYAHACDGDWMTVLLTGHDYQHTQGANSAAFALSAAPDDVLFTFTSQDPDASVFSLVSANATAGVLPALRSVTYNFDAHTVAGLCYGDNSATPCMTGTFDQSSYLTFDLSVNGTRAVSRSVYREWSLEDVPSVIMRRVDPGTGALAERLLQTSVGQCARLKVCVPAPPGDARVLGADVLVPVGWILNQFAPYAVKCTTPKSSN